jgi:hypothetical protein
LSKRRGRKHLRLQLFITLNDGFAAAVPVTMRR